LNQLEMQKEFPHLHNINNDDFLYTAMRKCHLCHKLEPLRTRIRATSAMARATPKTIADETRTLHGEAGMIALQGQPALVLLAFGLGIHARRGSV
jgi:hypothetical protein